MTPFGFAFNNAGTLVVSEAFGGAPNQSAASSYSASDDGILSVIGGSVPNSQNALAGWSSLTMEDWLLCRTLAAARSPAILSIPGTDLSLLNGAAANTGMGSAPIDMTLSVNSRILFVHLAGTQSVASLRIGGNGSLTLVDTAGGLPMGAQGIAAK
jgi:hypothetical protein